MEQTLNSIYDKWWKPAILPSEWEVTNKKITISTSHHNGSGCRYHHKLPLTEYV